ncbi:MAG TPA: hypothetical protein VGF59_07890 [Bryobacteraceae bacterium]
MPVITFKPTTPRNGSALTSAAAPRPATGCSVCRELTLAACDAMIRQADLQKAGRTAQLEPIHQAAALERAAAESRLRTHVGLCRLEGRRCA